MKTIKLNTMRKLLLFAALIAVNFTSFAQVGIGTKTPNASAALDVTSTTQGFLPPRMTKVQLEAIVTPVEGLMVYCSDCTTKGIYVYTGAAFEQIAGSSISDEILTAGTGKTWKRWNLGAAREATSSTDAGSYGDLYQWGRNTDGHEQRNSATVSGPVASGTEGASFITNATTPFDWLSTQDDVRWGATKTLNDPCPTGFRVPTETELNNEFLQFDTNNAAGAYASELKLPVAGYRAVISGALSSVGSYGDYWSSTVSGTSARHLLFSSSSAYMFSNYRAYAFSVRCIKD